MKRIKIFLTLAVAAALLLLVVFKFSVVTSKFECGGELGTKYYSGEQFPRYEKRAVAAYIKLDEYRWWVGLWGESDAALHVEIPFVDILYFSNLKRVGDQYQIFDSQKELKGNFSKLSNALGFEMSNGYFKGTCKEKE